MAFGNEEWIVEQCLVFEGCFRSEVSKKRKKGENSEKGEREEIALTAGRDSIGIAQNTPSSVMHAHNRNWNCVKASNGGISTPWDH